MAYPDKKAMKERMDQSRRNNEKQITYYSMDHRGSQPGIVEDCSSYVDWVINGNNRKWWYTGSMVNYNNVGGPYLADCGYKRIAKNPSEIAAITTFKFGDVFVRNSGETGQGSGGHTAICYSGGIKGSQILYHSTGGEGKRPGPGTPTTFAATNYSSKPWQQVWRIKGGEVFIYSVTEE